MESYEIRWKRSAERDLRDIDHGQIQQIIVCTGSLAGNPLPHGCRKLKGTERHFRIRTGDYRVVYHIDNKSKIVTIYYIRYRKDAYRK